MCGVTAVLVRALLRKTTRICKLTFFASQLGDTKATTAAVDLHESLYFLQHVSHLLNDLCYAFFGDFISVPN